MDDKYILSIDNYPSDDSGRRPPDFVHTRALKRTRMRAILSLHLLIYILTLISCKNNVDNTSKMNPEYSVMSLQKINNRQTEGDSNECSSLHLIDEPCFECDASANNYDLRIQINSFNQLKMLKISEYKGIKFLTIKITPKFSYGIAKWHGRKFLPLNYQKLQSLITDSSEASIRKKINNLHFPKKLTEQFDGKIVTYEEKNGTQFTKKTGSIINQKSYVEFNEFEQYFDSLASQYIKISTQ